MSYSKHFRLADDMITHLDTVIDDIDNPFISSRYTGFVAVAAVTVYELAIKDIFCEFGTKKHKVLGNFTFSFFNRINGRIKLTTIKTDYISRFGDKYVKKFENKVQEAEKFTLREYSTSLTACYGNVIAWRNQFAHEGKLPSTATYHEVTKSYQIGKKIIICLAETMKR